MVFTASDGTNTGNAETITILIDDINEFSPIISPESFSINENSDNNTSLGFVIAEDQDSDSDLIDWTITEGNSDDIFSISW